MADRRRPPDQRDVKPIEVPLTGPGSLASDTQANPTLVVSAADRHVRSRVWTAGLVALALLGVSVLASAVLLGLGWIDDDRTADRRSRPDMNDPASTVTTLPSLSALDQIPTPDGVPAAPVGPGAPARAGSLLDQVSVPTYPKAIRDSEAQPGGYDLVAAIAALEHDIPRTSSTHLEIGVGGFITDVAIVRDPVTDRYQVTLGDVIAIVDPSTGDTLVDLSSPGEQRWATVDQRSFADSVGVDSIGALYSRLLLGPVRPDTRAWATVTPGDLVTIDELTVAREFTVELPGSAIPEWQLYALGPTAEFTAVDLPTRLTYRVYVDRQNTIRRVVGLSNLGSTPQLVVHNLGTLAERFPIELPDSAAIER